MVNWDVCFGSSSMFWKDTDYEPRGVTLDLHRQARSLPDVVFLSLPICVRLDKSSSVGSQIGHTNGPGPSALLLGVVGTDSGVELAAALRKS